MGGGDRPHRAVAGRYPRTNTQVRGPEIRHIYNDRLSQFTAAGEYSDVNLQSCLYHGRVDTEEYLSIEVYSAPKLERPLFKDAIKQQFRKATKGEEFGPSWSTHWFRITIHKLPSEWKDYERVQLEFDLPEGLVYSEGGLPLQGLTGGFNGDRRVDFILSDKVRRSTGAVLYIETSMNGMFGVGNGGNYQPPDQGRYFRLASADLVAPNMEAWRLFWDFWIIKDISRELPENGYESHEALRVANEIMNTFQRGDSSSVAKCRKLAQKILGEKIDSSEVYKTPGKSFVLAVGNCHIDTAWLWPFAETKRKVARSWATQIDLMHRYPEHVFTCSQAQQYKWLEQDYPKLFEQVAAMIKKGSFEPIGGTWVEMDTNMPSGEALVRQFLFGQRLFRSRFNKTCKVFWLPDTFGYSAQLPQLARLAGMKHFFTQKLSWNNINNFPHSTFNWQALDGSQVLTHMAPDDTYTAQADLADVLRSETQHKSLSDDRNSLLAFGNGDGGGGPLAAMMEKLRRCRGASDTNAPSVPRVKMGTVTEFYEKVEKDSDYGRNLRTWSGELYFELHRGTYTSQAKTKFYNRATERLLHEIEYYGALAMMHNSSYKYPKSKVDCLWEDVLLCQFHDVLPGSSIGMVYQDEHRMHQNVLDVGQIVLKEALKALSIDDDLAEEDSKPYIISSLSWDRQEVVDVDVLSTTTSAKAEGDARIQDHGAGSYTLSNKQVIIKITDGCITSFFDLTADREIIPHGQRANEFQIYEDQPLDWQAWDVEIFHLDKPPIILSDPTSSIVSTHPNRVSILVEHKISEKSWIKSEISLTSSHVSDDCCKQLDVSNVVEWHENKRFLKVAFPVDVKSDCATYETQFGVVRRPTHRNTSWDTAKFEVCAHKFADLSEFDYGVSILNDCKYGFATLGNVMRLSLLRAPKAPDDNADMGRHEVRYAIMAHSKSFEQSNVVRRGFEFNYPLRKSRIAGSPPIPITISGSQNVILDTIKPGEDRGFVVRMYESLGGHAKVTLHTPRKAKFCRVNLLEDFIAPQKEVVSLRPFEVVSILVEM